MVAGEHLVTGELPVPLASKGFKRVRVRADLRREGHVELADKPTEHRPLNRHAKPRPCTSSGGGTCPARRPEEMETTTTGRRATPAMRCPRLPMHTHPIVREHRVLQGGHDNMGFAVAGDHGKVQDSTLQRARCQLARIMVYVVLL